jgi:small subunit ribosomal protein S16
MVKIRLMRVGKTKQPSYRVVVADSRSPRDGRIIEAIGHYQPRREPSEIVIDSDRAVYWLGRGAQPSNTVKNLMRLSGAWAEFTGEAPPAPPTPPTQEEARKRATAAASVSAAEDAPEAPAGEQPAEVPEAAEQSDAAPEAEDSDSGDSDSGDSDSSDSGAEDDKQ